MVHSLHHASRVALLAVLLILLALAGTLALSAAAGRPLLLTAPHSLQHDSNGARANECPGSLPSGC